MRNRRLAAVEHARDIGADDAIPFVVRHLRDWHADTDPGVVHEHVEAAELRDGGPHGELRRRDLAHVADNGGHLSELGELAFGFDDAIFGSARDGDRVAGLQQGLRQGAADSSRSTRDQDHSRHPYRISPWQRSSSLAREILAALLRARSPRSTSSRASSSSTTSPTSQREKRSMLRSRVRWTGTTPLSVERAILRPSSARQPSLPPIARAQALRPSSPQALRPSSPQALRIQNGWTTRDSPCSSAWPASISRRSSCARARGRRRSSRKASTKPV